MKLSREVKTGIIVLAGIALFILGFSYLKSNSIFDESKKLYAVYNHVGGLQTGTVVTINGFNVGNVSDIKFKDKSGKLLVTLIINNKFEFSKNSTAELFDTGIIGGKGIQINPVFDGSAVVQSGDTLKAVIKPGLTELVQEKLTPLQLKVEDAVSNADSLLVNVNEVLDDRTKLELRQSISGLNSLVQSFQKSANALNALMVENQTEIDSSLKNVNAITSNFASISNQLKEANLENTMQDFSKSVENLNLLLAKIDQGQGTLGKMANNEELYNNLSSASKELDLLLQDFRLNPKRYVNVSVFGKKQKEYTLPENDPAEEINN